MKVIGVISTTALLLLFGATVPAFAQEDHHEQEAKPAQHEQRAEPAQQEEHAKPHSNSMPNRRRKPSLLRDDLFSRRSRPNPCSSNGTFNKRTNEACATATCSAAQQVKPRNSDALSKRSRPGERSGILAECAPMSRGNARYRRSAQCERRQSHA